MENGRDKMIDTGLTKKGTTKLLRTSIDEIKLRYYAILRDHEDRIRDLEKQVKKRKAK